MEKNCYKSTNKKGFTLVELVIVIVIVGILSTISVSAYSSLSLKAVEAEGASLVNFIAKNEVTYQIENGVFLNIPNDVQQSDALGVNLNISKYFQTFKATVSTDDEGEPFVFIVIKGTYRGNDITLSFGRSVSGYNSGILRGSESNDENLAKLKCKQHKYRYGNNGNGNDNGNGTGNGKGNNGNANGQDNGNNGNDNGGTGNGNNGNNGKDNGGNGNNDKKDDPDDDKSQGQGNGNKD